MANNKELIDITSAANILGVSKLTLRNWDSKGILKAIRIGKRKDRRYRKADIELFLKDKEYRDIDVFPLCTNNSYAFNYCILWGLPIW